MALSARLRSSFSSRSIWERSASGMSLRMADSPNALGLATSAGTSDAGFLTSSPCFHDLGRDATCLPCMSTISTVRALAPARRSRLRQAGPAQ